LQRHAVTAPLLYPSEKIKPLQKFPVSAIIFFV
jgi:hypothetical protein